MERTYVPERQPGALGMSGVFTVAEAAELLKTSRQQIRKMIQLGELPAVKVGREWRIPVSGIAAFLAG